MQKSGEVTDKATENVYVRLKPTTVEKLDIRAAQMRVKRPAAIASAVEAWLDGFFEGAAPASGESPFAGLSREYQRLLADVADLIQTNPTFEASIRAQVGAIRHVTPKSASKPAAKRKAS